jgi:hypothetical protein
MPRGYWQRLLSVVYWPPIAYRLSPIGALDLLWACHAQRQLALLRRCVIGYWLLAIGYWLLAVGYWLLAIDYWLLAFGYWLLQ